MLPSLLMDQNNLNDAGKFVEQIYYSGRGTNTLFYPILCKRKHYDRAQFIFCFLFFVILYLTCNKGVIFSILI